MRAAGGLRWVRGALASLAAATAGSAAPGGDDFTGDLRRWSVEQQPGGSVAIADRSMEIVSAGGTTVWWRSPLRAPVEIAYSAELVMAGGPHDRLSDLNCFWMAEDPALPDGALPRGRSGRFSDYDSLRTYYVGIGGNDNTTTRFRRYDGAGNRPLLPEHDLADARFLLRAGHQYRIRIVVWADRTEFWRDGERLFSYRDPAPLTAGYFAIRTVRSHLRIRDFRTQAPQEDPAPPANVPVDSPSP